MAAETFSEAEMKRVHEITLATQQALRADGADVTEHADTAFLLYLLKRIQHGYHEKTGEWFQSGQ